MFCILQAPIDYHGLRETGRLKTREGYRLQGLPYSDGKVYTVEENDEHGDLAVYQMYSDSRSLILIDCMDLGRGLSLQIHVSSDSHGISPSIDRHSHRVFLPVGNGVLVARLEGEKLFKERILQSVGHVDHLAVIPLDTLYVCDLSSEAVRIIDSIHDTVTGTLEPPALTLSDLRPSSVAVQGDNVVVCYSKKSQHWFWGEILHCLVAYRHGNLAPIRVLYTHDIPEGVLPPHLFTVDCEGHALLAHTDIMNAAIFDVINVININGNVYRVHAEVYRVHAEVNAKSASLTCGCAIVNRQLWVARYSGDIVIMSPGKAHK